MKTRQRRWLGLTLMLWIPWIARTGAGEAVQRVRLEWAKDSSPAITNAAAVLARQLTQRCVVSVANTGAAPLTIVLAMEPGLPAEGYEIVARGEQTLRVLGADQRGLLYGLGKLLRDGRYDHGGFTVGAWRGRSAPDCSFRALYAATHFMNFYEAAPVEEVRTYVEDLALWGVNTVVGHFPTWNFQSLADPAARRNLDRLREIFRVAKRLGLQVGLVQCPNQGFANAPAEWRAAAFPDPLGRRGKFGVNCCASQPSSQRYLLELYDRLFAEFADLGLDYLVLWPYDEGGCGCAECWPWGAKGFPKVARQVAAAGRSRFPALKSVLSTWVYDTPPAGEWEGLNHALGPNPIWPDFILADSHTDFPRYPLEHGAPGKLPLLNFPEISMWGRSPWGGYGANPLPNRIEQLWRQTQGKLSGGMPYSEGIFEDLNKTMCFQLYWRKDRSPESIAREYLAFEYSPDLVEDLWKVVCDLEATWLDRGLKSVEAWQVIQAAESRLTPQAKSAWRWRIFRLRAQIDAELLQSKGKFQGETLKTAFEELTRLYHAENAHSMPVQPPRVP